MLLSESILYHRWRHLNSFRFPGPIDERANSTPPTIDPQNPATYQLAKVNGNIVYCFPNGSSVLSIPLVAMSNTRVTFRGKYYVVYERPSGHP
jgi:hypothetical protein